MSKLMVLLRGFFRIFWRSAAENNPEAVYEAAVEHMSDQHQRLFMAARRVMAERNRMQAELARIESELAQNERDLKGAFITKNATA